MLYKTNIIPEGYIFELSQSFSLQKTLISGQCFRWTETEEGIEGIASNYPAIISQPNANTIIVKTKGPDATFWANYLDLDRDYHSILKILEQDEILKLAIEKNEGIHILNQEPWETLASFIISQNNNIKRIRGIIQRLCENFGTLLPDGNFSFPEASKLAGLSPDDLAPLRSGFRAKYLIDAANRVTDGRLSINEISILPCEDARKKLMEIYGVGRKVADCALLYGFKHIDVCPVDVWMKRALALYENSELPDYVKPYAGIAQQYLFETIRMNYGGEE